MNYTKYKKAYFPVPIKERDWCGKEITHAPVWCSVDLRDGNQALYSPMTIEEKLEFFDFLVRIGFKEIEVGFPAASKTEFSFIRRLIEEDRIPDDVTIQVLTQAREHIIKKTVEALDGAKNVIIHLYNSTSPIQRRVVFRKEKDEIIKIATDGAQLLKELTAHFKGNLRFEYSPESFTCTEMEYAAEICNKVLDILTPSPESKTIINLPSTIEVATANVYADQIEYMHKHLNFRENIVISVHAHNDRGTGVASSELALLAGADRVEGTIFGNGERTGNADIITIALNMFSQGIDPELDISDIDMLAEVYKKFNRMPIHPRHPYVGDMAYVAFSGSHQDAIKKSMDVYEHGNRQLWENPYLTIDPTDIGRTYEPILINSQSGKGGISYVMENKFGYTIPKKMLAEFSAIIQSMSDKRHTVVPAEEILETFKASYVNIHSPLKLAFYKIDAEGEMTLVSAAVEYDESVSKITGRGNGPLDALCKGLCAQFSMNFEIVSYQEHNLEYSSDSRAATYICIKDNGSGEFYWGAGINENINTSSVYALISAVNKLLKKN